MELTAFTEIADGFSANLQTSTGEKQVIAPRWIVGCDGIHSFVRKTAGLDFTGENYEGMVMQMMDVHYQGLRALMTGSITICQRTVFLLLTKLPNGRHRVLISDTGEAADPNLTPRQAFQRLVDGHVSGTELAEPDWATKWELWRRITDNYSTGNCFLPVMLHMCIHLPAVRE